MRGVLMPFPRCSSCDYKDICKKKSMPLDRICLGYSSASNYYRPFDVGGSPWSGCLCYYPK